MYETTDQDWYMLLEWHRYGVPPLDGQFYLDEFLLMNELYEGQIEEEDDDFLLTLSHFL